MIGPDVILTRALWTRRKLAWRVECEGRRSAPSIPGPSKLEPPNVTGWSPLSPDETVVPLRAAPAARRGRYDLIEPGLAGGRPSGCRRRRAGRPGGA